MLSLTDQVAVVTGASRGIGRSIAETLAVAGARLVLVSRRAEDTAELARQIQERGGEALSLAADVGDAAQVDGLFQTAQERFGRVDILVNNAGINRDALLARMKDDDWDSVLRINLTGAFLCSRAAARLMSKQRYGRIINISSVVGQMGNAGQANYCASKAGLAGMTRSMARELARRNITVNAVAPGFIETDMTAALPEKIREQMLDQIPCGRFGEAADVAAVVCFLASPTAAYITGQEFAVNGGMFMA